MGMYGKDPISDFGRYFHRSVWTWHPLWEYVQSRCPWVDEHVTYGHSNDGDGSESDARIRSPESQA